MKKRQKMFLHRLMSEVIVHSLYENKRRNFARCSYTEQYLQTITYQLILFSSTAIKYAVDCKLPFRRKSSVQFDADSDKGMCYHSGSLSVLLSEQLQSEYARLTFGLPGQYCVFEAQWETIPPNNQKKICEIHLKRVQKKIGEVSGDDSGDPVVTWDRDVLEVSDEE